MVIRLSSNTTARSQRGFMVAELVLTILVLAVAMIPLAYSFNLERKLVRAQYDRVIAMEIVDGEIELLRAGEWRSLAEGKHPYAISAGAAKNLPPGNFIAERAVKTIRLEWLPAKRGAGGRVAREIVVPE